MPMNDPNDSPLVFPSKVDAWLGAIVVAAMIVPVGVAIMLALDSRTSRVALPVLAGEVLLFGFIAWVFAGTRYIVGERDLLIRSGPFRWRVELADIASIRPTSNPLSSPALSLDRLEIRHGHGKWVLISPRDKSGFLEAMTARSPGLVPEGEGLRRTA
jgi:hypothetical protein